MANIKIINCKVNGNASIIRHIHEATKISDINFERIIADLKRNKSRFDNSSAEFRAVEVLEQNASSRDWNSLYKSIEQFSTQFASATLANIAGSYLSQLFHIG